MGTEILNYFNPFTWNWDRSATLAPVQIKDTQGNITTSPNNNPWTAGDIVYSVFNPIGEGENAMSIGQMGLGLYSALQQQKMFNAQLDEARKQYAYQKALTGANFQNQATNWGNQSLFQAQSLAGFNPEAGANRVADLNAAFNQINAAGNRIGVNNVVGEQQNALQKYNKLVGA